MIRFFCIIYFLYLLFVFEANAKNEENIIFFANDFDKIKFYFLRYLIASEENSKIFSFIVHFIKIETPKY